MLTQKVECHEIISFQSPKNLPADLIHLKVHMICNSAPDGSHNQLIALEEVSRIAQVLENNEIRLHSDDAI